MAQTSHPEVKWHHSREDSSVSSFEQCPGRKGCADSERRHHRNSWRLHPHKIAPFPVAVQDNSSVNDREESSRAAESVETEDLTGLVAPKSARQSPEAAVTDEDESRQKCGWKNNGSW